ncbi:MAG: DMT family transporter [Candidatus Bathyarchaeota archaeon]|nr:DMT family transporter [Candidatus Bathyarchaeota archaeon]MDH5787242.1 DMT family transporter [Candidatus Bathyarchaeota archaeon]
MIGELAALGAALSWTLSAMLYKKALQGATPISANILRLACTSAILLTFMIVIGKFEVLTSLPTETVVLAGVSGIIGLGFGDTLYMNSLKLIGVARAVPITCTYPLFNLLWATFLANEPLTLQVVLGAFIIVIGIWLLSREKEKSSAETQGKIMARGVAAALATAVTWSISITMINMAVRDASTLDQVFAINTIRVTAIAIFLLVSVLGVNRGLSFLKVQRKTLAELIAGGIAALGLGWFFLTYSFMETLESRAVPISSTTPLFSTLAGMILLHEKVTAKTAVSSIIIVIGIFLIFVT